MEAVLEPTITLDPDKEYEIVDSVPEWLWQLPASIVPVRVAPDDTYEKVTNQFAAHLKAGASQVWLLMPEDQMIIIRYSMTSFRVFRKNDLFMCEDVLPGFRCKVGDLFSRPKRRS